MHRRALISSVLAVGLIFGAAAPAGASTGRSDRAPAAPVYLALGDSVAAGYGASTPYGYVGLLHAQLRTDLDCTPAQAPQAADGCKHLGLVDLAENGATTTTLIDDQLPAAVALLAARNQDDNPRNDVEVVTVTIGGNDLVDAVPVVQQNCIQIQDPAACTAVLVALLSTYTGNLTQILSQLRAAGGPDLTIVTTAYYNPLLPPCSFFMYESLANVVLEGGDASSVLPLPFGMNDVTRSVSALYDAQVAEAFGALDAGDLVGDCLHPNQSGHEILATLFEAAIFG